MGSRFTSDTERRSRFGLARFAALDESLYQ